MSDKEITTPASPAGKKATKTQYKTVITFPGVLTHSDFLKLTVTLNALGVTYSETETWTLTRSGLLKDMVSKVLDIWPKKKGK
jgi:hypothetical protein